MEVRRGIPVSPGIGIGDAVVIGHEDLRIRRRYVPPEKVDDEIQNLDRAVERTVAEISEELARFGGDMIIARQVLESHRDMAADQTLRQEIAESIRSKSYSAEYALALVFRGYYRRFEAMESDYISERSTDLADIEKKLLRTLLGKSGALEAPPSKDSVIIGHDLSPSQMARLDKERVKGVAIDVGGRTSHTAIMARAMKIPDVVGLEKISREVVGDEPVIVDGYTGAVIIDPDEKTLEEYRRRASLSEKFYRTLHREIRFPSETLDGFEIFLAANIEFPEEIRPAIEWGARGVGLYRTEFLYEKGEPDEDVHYRSYCKAVEQLRGRPLIIRTLDAGADKFHTEAVHYHEPNPFLGCRSIRLCFSRPELFIDQIRAILRASALGRVLIMLPMVSNLEELRKAKEMIHQVQEDLTSQGIEFDPRVPLGIMVEVPSTALMADQFAREVDFFSIGTNDLVQYCLAVDRINERVAELYQPTHPAVLRLISTVIEAGNRHGIGVSICGEMCSEPIYSVLLLGLGLRSFSLSPIAIPTVKRIIRQLTMRDAVEVARQCLDHESAEQSQRFLQAHVKSLLPEFVGTV